MFTGSIVLYNNDRSTLLKAIESFLSVSRTSILYLVDNSLTDDLKTICNDLRIVYIHNPNNPGFGASHNTAINLAFELNVNYHLIINPDTYFTEDPITPMLNYMRLNPDTGMIMPQILNNDHSIQYLPKLLPNVFWIFRRKLKKFDLGYKNFINRYELRHIASNRVYNSPILSGCFTILNLEAIKEVGAYDDRFFMYFEDFDLSRRIHEKYKTIYFPLVSVYHGYERGASKSLRLFKIFIFSAIKYFSKWGWFHDRRRISINRKSLEQF